jgi:outer membrane protein
MLPQKPVFLSLLFLFAFNAYSQEKWDLKKCIDYALEKNLQVKQAQVNADISKETLLQSEASTLPSLNGFATNNYNFGQTIDPFTNQFANSRVRSNNLGLNSSVVLFNGLQTLNTIKQNKYNLMANKYNVEKVKNDIALNIATAYLQILFNEELLSIAENQLGITRQQVKRIDQLVNVGTQPKGKLLEVQAQEASEELSVVNAQNNLDISYLTLIQLMQFDSAENFSIVKPSISLPSDINSVPTSPGQVYDAALTSQPVIKSAEYMVLGFEKNVAVAKGTISPRITLNGSFGTGYSGLKQDITAINFSGFDTIGYTTSGETVVRPAYTAETKVRGFGDQLNDNLNKSIGFTLSVPIFNGLSSYTSVKRAKLNLLNAQYDLENTKNQLERTIEQAHADANAALKKYKATLKSVEALKESFGYTEQRFNVGLVNTVEYNDAKNTSTFSS